MSKPEIHVDVCLFGAGIAGLWTLNALQNAGYSCILLESRAIGSGQTIAAQGIVHSGLKFALTGKISALSRELSAMNARWESALDGQDLSGVDLSAVQMNAQSQYLLTRPGLMGGVMNAVTGKMLGRAAHEVKRGQWPKLLEQSGFDGRMIEMGEPVLDMPSLTRALAAPHNDRIRKIDWPEGVDLVRDEGGGLAYVDTPEVRIRAQRYALTAAAGNREAARKLGLENSVEIQHRPLLMGMLRPAPFPLFAHMVGKSDKPVATITTHRDSRGRTVWYLGAGIAERARDSDPGDVKEAAVKAFQTYLPGLHLQDSEWAVWPVDRVEGRAAKGGWMPDTPTLNVHGNVLFAWPTKMTFAPLLSDWIVDKLAHQNVTPRHAGLSETVTCLPKVPLANPPWDVENEWYKWKVTAKVTGRA